MLYAMLLAAIFLEYSRPGYLFPVIETLKLNSLVPLGTFLLAIFSTSKISFEQIFTHYNTKWFLFFFFLVLLSFLHADVTQYVLDIFKGDLGYFFMFLMIAKLVDTVDKLKGLIVTLILAHVFLLANNPELILQPESRHYIQGGTFLGDGNDFSLSLVILIPFALFLYLDSKNIFKKYYHLAMLIILILSVVGTQSRGATLAMAASFLYLWWRSKSKVWGIVVMAILVLGIMIYAPPVYFERMNTIANYEEEGSAQGRIMAWKSGVRMAIASPLLGQGVGHFPVKLGTEFRPPEYGERNLPWLTAHSSYFLVLGEMGLPGIIYLVGIIVMNIRRHDNYFKSTSDESSEDGIRMNRLFGFSVAGMIGFAVAGAFLSVAYYPHIFILSGIFCVIYFLHDDFAKRQKNDSALSNNSKKNIPS